MTYKLIRLIHKDLLSLIRDRAGLLMLFLMPLTLVLIMTNIQDNTFNVVRESRIPALLLNLDQDSLGCAIERELYRSQTFDLHQSLDETPLTPQTLEAAVARGEYLLGIIIPQGATHAIRKNVARYINGVFSGAPVNKEPDSVNIRVFLDPTTKSSFRRALAGAMHEYSMQLEADFLFKEITREVNKISPIPIDNIELSRSQVKITEQYAALDQDKLLPNSVQHNIPAWGIFSIFFIVVSLSGNLLKEREDGCMSRLMVMPCPFALYITSKVVVYTVLCLTLSCLMLLMGFWIFPLTGLPALMMGHSISGMLLMFLTASLAAIGYGVAIATFSTSYQQTTIFAPMSVVILAAIGGIWIPAFTMPPLMQHLTTLSPMNWGLEGLYDIFVRDGNFFSVLPEALSLTLFAILCFGVSAVYHHHKKNT
jgi:ABC-2 type transport system permease protein